MYKIFLVFVLVALVLTGCQPTTSKSEYSTVQVCKDLALFRTSMDKLNSMQGNSTPAEVDAQMQVVRQNFMNLTQSAANLKSVNLTALNDAINNLINGRAQLPQNVSIEDIFKALADNIAVIIKASDQAQTDLKCLQ
jgi:hypothetical protein